MMKQTLLKTVAAFLLTVTILPTALFGCGDNAGEKNNPDEGENTTSGQTSDETSQQPEVSTELTVKFASADGETQKEVTGEGTVKLAPGGRFKAGDTVTVELPEGQNYLAISLCDKIEEAILYVPKGVYTYEIPSDAKSYMNPAILNVPNVISVRIPTVDELKAQRNLALNPYDVKTTASSGFPHATTNNQYNAAEFGAHNVLDGQTKNTSHGLYPYQSWGAKETVKASDELVIQFGREVTVDSLVLYLRADFANNHDAYFSAVTVEFSDGTSIVVNPHRSAEGQSFGLGSVKTSSIKLTGFVTDKTRGTWAGFTEVQIMGSDIVE